MRTLSVVFALLAISLVTTDAFAQTADAENAALRTIIKAQRTASPVYPEVPLLSEELADVELLTDDDKAIVPILEDAILEDQDRESQRQTRAFVARLD